MLLAPVVRGRKGEHAHVLTKIKREGFVRVRVDGEIYLLEEDKIKLDKKLKHDIEIVIDRLKIKEGIDSRLSESVELAIEHGEGLLKVVIIGEDKNAEKIYSTKLACPEHGVSLEELEPRMFSFNSPFGACTRCMGLGFTQKIIPENLVKDKNLSIVDGALGNVFGQLDAMGYYRQVLNALSNQHNTSLDIKFNDLPESFVDELFFGTGENKLITDKYNNSNSGIVLYSDDLEKSRDELISKGLQFKGTDGSDKCLTFTDPDGNWFQLVNTNQH
jgi:excinuclease ABC subunit A